MTADRDDLAAILAKHERDGARFTDDISVPPRYICRCGEVVEDHQAHVVAMLLESDWLADVKADVWDDCRDKLLTGFVPGSEEAFKSIYPNPYRADRVDAEDGRR